MMQGIHSVLDTATRWCVDNNIRRVFVLEGYPVRGVPSPNRQPIILSSDNEGLDKMPENTESHDIEKILIMTKI